MSDTWNGLTARPPWRPGTGAQRAAAFMARCATLGWNAVRLQQIGRSCWEPLFEAAETMGSEALIRELENLDRHPGMTWRARR